MKRLSKEEWIISCVVMTCVFAIVFFMYCSWILFSMSRTLPGMERELIEIKAETEHIKYVEERNVNVNHQILEAMKEGTL
jgi:type VI protein secretion system component VasK